MEILRKKKLAIVQNGCFIHIQWEMDKDLALLNQHLPEHTAVFVLDMLRSGNIRLKIVGARKTKLGDFRPANGKQPFRITVNHDLNPYEFLFTVIHELAHYQIYVQKGMNHKPHGPEWRQAFARLLEPFLQMGAFPPELQQGIQEHFSKPGITDCSDHQLHELFRQYDPPSRRDAMRLHPTIDSLPINSLFSLPDGRQFIKLAIRRKRYSCFCFSNKQLYIFGPNVRVIPHNPHQ